MSNSRLKFSLTTAFVIAIVSIVVRIISKDTKTSVGFDANSHIFQKDSYENVAGWFDLLHTDVNYILHLDMSSIQDTAKFIETMNKLSLELPNFAVNLAIMAGENTLNFNGNQVRIYDVLSKWWEIHSSEAGAEEKFEESSIKMARTLNIPPHTIHLLCEAVRYKDYSPNPSKDQKIVAEIISHFNASGY